MNGFELDFRRLQPSLLAFGGVALLMGVLITGSHFYKAARHGELEAQENRLRTLDAGYRQAVRDRQAILAHYPRFKTLAAEGFLGTGARLSWVEEIREAALAAGVLTAHYRLNESTPQPVNLPVNTGEHGLYGNGMQVRLELAHEGDLLAFLDLLEARRLGVWDLQRCHVSRLTPPGEPVFESANVQADCRLMWFNLQGITLAKEGAGT